MKQQEEIKPSWNFCEGGKIELHGKFTKKELRELLITLSTTEDLEFKIRVPCSNKKTEVDFW